MARSFSRPNRLHVISELNVTPMLDLCFVLLIIFMVTAPLLSAGVPIDLPDSNAKPLDQTPSQIELSIATDGTVYLDKAVVAPGTLGALLAIGVMTGAIGSHLTKLGFVVKDKPLPPANPVS